MEANHCIIKKSGVTHVKTKQFKYTWTIKNFSNYINEVGQHFDSPSFATGEKNEFSWELELYPNGRSENHRDFVSIRPYIFGNKCNLNLITIVLSIIDRRGNDSVFASKVVDGSNFFGGGVYFSEFVKRDFLFDEANGLLPNGNLTIVCKMYDNQSFVNETGPTKCKILHRPVVEKLSPTDRRLLQFDYFEDLWDESEQSSDVMLVVDDDSKFPVHRCILAARSPVFAAMFEGDAKEQVKIEYIDEYVMRKVLRFIYCGKIADIQSERVDFLDASVKYQLDGLREVCEDVLIGDLSVGSVGEILALVDKYEKVEKLKAYTIDFVTRHAKTLIEDIRFKDEIKSLSSTLLADVINALLLKL